MDTKVNSSLKRKKACLPLPQQLASKAKETEFVLTMDKTILTAEKKRGGRQYLMFEMFLGYFSYKWLQKRESKGNLEKDGEKKDS